MLVPSGGKGRGPAEEGDRQRRAGRGPGSVERRTSPNNEQTLITRIVESGYWGGAGGDIVFCDRGGF